MGISAAHKKWNTGNLPTVHPTQTRLPPIPHIPPPPSKLRACHVTDAPVLDGQLDWSSGLRENL